MLKIQQTTTTADSHSHSHSLPLAERLRHDTRVQHDAIEQVAVMRRLFATDYQVDEYRSLLLRMYGFYAALEPSLFSDVPSELGLAQRRKTPWLAKDLAQLGTDAAELRVAPRCFSLPPTQAWPDKLGVFYVLEGSTLGGQVICRQLEQQFDWSPDGVDPLRFYYGYGDSSGHQWRTMKTLLNACDAGADQAVAAAGETFERLTAWLSSQAS